MNRTVSGALTVLLPFLLIACAPVTAPAPLVAPTASLSLAQIAALNEAGRVSMRRDAQRAVAGAHGATSIYDTAHFEGCPTSAEAQSLALIDAAAEDLDTVSAQAALDNARIAIDQLTADLSVRRLRDHPTLSRSAEFETGARAASDPEIADLLRRAATDQYLRGISAPVLLGAEPANAAVVESVFLRLKWPIMCESDASNAAWLQAALTKRVWFLRGTDGELAASAAWLLAQHADAFTQLQQDVLKRLEPLVQSGEIAASQYAYLYDRVGMATAGRQRFGTQMYCAGPQDWRARPVEDPEGLERRRAEAGLPTMADYIARGARFCTASDDELFG